uniref:Uncharacterized protein n=1 Tax=Timema genevievae TaxID=629358 RepID=A0A7R9JX72_TIMGE|nr:unnamed protein product [Timema genevievae]
MNHTLLEDRIPQTVHKLNVANCFCDGKSSPAIFGDEVTQYYDCLGAALDFDWDSCMRRATTWMIRKRRGQSMFAAETEGNTDESTQTTSVDKTTNVKGHLIYCKVLEHTNHSTVARFGSDGLKVLWPRGVHEEKVLEFYSDAMVTNDDGLKEKLGNDFYNI